ncbi:MAG: FecR family protein [Pseudomonadota bacterium]
MSSAEYEQALEKIEDVAAYWLDRVNAPDFSPQDRVAFEKWKREDPLNKEVFERLERGNEFADQFLGDPKILAMVEQARQETTPPFWRRTSIQMAAAAAAVAAIALPLSLSVFHAGPERGIFASLPGTISYETAIGERSTVTLADGSVVTLNTDSEITVDFSSAERNIDLLKGQAFFEVAKDSSRPFVVDAGDKRIIALGTAFDVRFKDEGRVEVTLVEGLVDVDFISELSNNDSSNINAATPARTVSLKPGERLVASASPTPEIVKPEIDNEISWRDGLLVFQDRPLAEVVAEMNRYSTQKMILDDDPRLEMLEVSGVFNTGRASTFVTALETMHPLDASRTGRSEIMLVWRN